MEDLNDKVHIPDSFEDSDAESDTLSEKIRRLEGYGDLGQGGSKTQGDGESHQLWHMEHISDIATVNQIIQGKSMEKASDDISKTGMLSQDNQADGIDEENGMVNTQESTITITEHTSQNDIQNKTQDIDKIVGSQEATQLEYVKPQDDNGPQERRS